MIRDKFNDRVHRSGLTGIRHLIQPGRTGESQAVVVCRPSELGTIEPSKKTRRYWVQTQIGTCSRCGRDQTRRERVYDRPPPPEAADRIVLLTEDEISCDCS